MTSWAPRQLGAKPLRPGPLTCPSQRVIAGRRVSQRPSIVPLVDEIFDQPSRSLAIATGFAMSDRRGEGVHRIAMRQALCFG
jgi:hypothetical protein